MLDSRESGNEVYEDDRRRWVEEKIGIRRCLGVMKRVSEGKEKKEDNEGTKEVAIKTSGKLKRFQCLDYKNCIERKR